MYQVAKAAKHIIMELTRHWQPTASLRFDVDHHHILIGQGVRVLNQCGTEVLCSFSSDTQGGTNGSLTGQPLASRYCGSKRGVRQRKIVLVDHIVVAQTRSPSTSKERAQGVMPSRVGPTLDWRLEVRPRLESVGGVFITGALHEEGADWSENAAAGMAGPCIGCLNSVYKEFSF